MRLQAIRENNIDINLYSLCHGVECSGDGAQRGFGVIDLQTVSRLAASATAHLAALIAASEPSIPTTIKSVDCGGLIAFLPIGQVGPCAGEYPQDPLI
jgi:hypothetical protein